MDVRFQDLDGDGYPETPYLFDPTGEISELDLYNAYMEDMANQQYGGTGDLQLVDLGGGTQAVYNPNTGQYSVNWGDTAGNQQYIDIINGDRTEPLGFDDWAEWAGVQNLDKIREYEQYYQGTTSPLEALQRGYDKYLSTIPTGGVPYDELGPIYQWALTQLPESVVEGMSPDELISWYMASQPETMSEYQQQMLALERQQLARQQELDAWNQKWQMAQSPSSPQPSGFAGWGMDYEWSPSAYMSGGQGWMNSPMSMEEMNNPYLYGSGAWAQAAGNWWDVSRINQTLEQSGRASDMQYTGMVPGVVANYFQGIEPYMYARDINSNMTSDPYQLSSMPSWGDIQGWTTPQMQQMQAAFENIHTPYTWEDMLRTSYAQAPPGGSGFSGLNYYR